MTKNNIQKFLELNAIDYDGLDYDGMSESEHNITHKRKWLLAGAKSFNTIATLTDGKVWNVSQNKSGSIDRGYISGFVSDPQKTKFVYISICDGMHDILYRTAKDSKDYTGGSNHTASISESGFDTVVSFIKNYFEQNND